MRMSSVLCYPKRLSSEFLNYKLIELVHRPEYSRYQELDETEGTVFQGCASPILASGFLFKKEHLMHRSRSQSKQAEKSG